MITATPMPTMPALSGSRWNATAHGLHQAAQLLGALRALVCNPVPNYLELSLTIRPDGISTGALLVGEVMLDFGEATLSYTPPGGAPMSIPLTGHSQASLFDALLATMETEGQGLAPQAQGGSSRIDAFMAALDARGLPITPRREDVAGEAALQIDPTLAADYSRALDRIFTATARFRARLNGPMTPVVVWPEHFDLSFLWFATAQATDQHPHMNFGFAPFSDGIERPYLYAYAYPMPTGFEALPLPPGVRWHTEGWQGIVVPYDELAVADDPATMVEDIFSAVYHLLSPSLAAVATHD